MTLATAMYYLGFDPYTGKKLYVARDISEKRRQKEYFFKGKGKRGPSVNKLPSGQF
jgi:hypothetical protein